MTADERAWVEGYGHHGVYGFVVRLLAQKLAVEQPQFVANFWFVFVLELVDEVLHAPRFGKIIHRRSRLHLDTPPKPFGERIVWGLVLVGLWQLVLAGRAQ